MCARVCVHVLAVHKILQLCCHADFSLFCCILCLTSAFPDSLSQSIVFMWFSLETLCSGYHKLSSIPGAYPGAFLGAQFPFKPEFSSKL